MGRGKALQCGIRGPAAGEAVNNGLESKALAAG